MSTATTTTATPTSFVGRVFGTVSALRAWVIGSLAVNMLLVVTGAVVRLTSSGLGCPTWPQCSGADYVPVPQLGVHGVIEFGNRLLTFVLVALAVGAVVAAFWVKTTAAGASMRPIRILAIVVALGIPFQGVIGGITVLTRLNPWVVALHMVLSVVIISLCVVMLHRAYDTRPLMVSRLVRRLVVGIAAVTGLVILLGTVVTGAGPHAGDGAAQRNGIDPVLAAHVHAISVWALVGLTIVVLALTKSLLVATLLAVQLLQGVIGYVQYFTGLPILGVALHMTGLAILTAFTAHVVWRMREVAPVADAGYSARRPPSDTRSAQ